MLTKSLFAGALFTLSEASRPKITMLTVKPRSGAITDEFGREVILHGVNVVPKLPPYIPITEKFDPQTSLVDKDFKDLASWGMNLVRLGVMWEAVERTPGVYDMEYLDKIE
jgi:endoglycosylceramidase